MAYYTVGSLKEQRIGNFSIQITESYGLINSVSVKIYYCYIGEGIFGRKKEKTKLLYKGNTAHFKRTKAQKLIEDKINEKLPIFIRMEKEGKIKL